MLGEAGWVASRLLESRASLSSDFYRLSHSTHCSRADELAPSLPVLVGAMASRKRRRPLPDFDSSAAFFEHYYRLQFCEGSSLLDAGELQAFLRTLRLPLPATFRLCGGASLPALPLGCISPTNLSWCDGWQLPCNVVELTRGGSRWRRWLAVHGASGVLSRQEAVSMLPVHVLGVKPHHAVLDMCAAPGSKTLQVLDALGPSGSVVANELDPKRAHTLVHRCRRLGADAAGRVRVAGHRAQALPASLAPRLGFDRVVCDVPCSGDGTLRKSPKMWEHWVPHYGLGLHSTQLQIALRGAALLRVGGLMAYSTCSFNPLENEAVVAALLASGRGALELVDLHRGNEFTGRHGLTCWAVMDDRGRVYKSFEESQRERGCRQRFRRSMWPPDPAEAEALLRCSRILPQDHDTGGFFVALVRKLRPLAPPSVPENGETTRRQRRAADRRRRRQLRRRSGRDDGALCVEGQ